MAEEKSSKTRHVDAHVYGSMQALDKPGFTRGKRRPSND